MCGRYTLFDDQDNFEIMNILNELNRKYPDNNMKTGEIFPTNTAPVLLNNNHMLAPELSAWGFPGFQGKGVIINARSETAADKKTFRDSLLFRRCIIPTTGFYEWTQDKKKEKYLFTLPDSPVLYLAGFYNVFKGERRFVILTTESNSSVSDIHNRMPVIISPDVKEKWVNDTDMALNYIRSTMPDLKYQNL